MRWRRAICFRQVFLVRGGLHIKINDGFGFVRDLFGVRLGSVRGLFGVRSGSVWGPFGICHDDLCGVRKFFVRKKIAEEILDKILLAEQNFGCSHIGKAAC